MQNPIEYCIVIPCYNEGKKFPSAEYCAFIESQSNVLICFVNDGSEDNTLEILESIKNKFPERIELVTYSKNSGKAEAVREGIIHCNKKFNHQHIAFLDADLSTSLQECAELKIYLSGPVCFCFGSRMMRIGAVVQRKYYRFLIGRIIATFISNILHLKVYDTQCGCKVFTKDVSEKLFREKFISRWLFDVEIFFRMIILYGRNDVLSKMIEVPLKQWIDSGDSKVKFSYFFKLWIDLLKINHKYKKLIKKSI